MEPRGPLMMEHRLIERMIGYIRSQLENIAATREIDGWFIDSTIDFMQRYADRTHQTKEEDIFYRHLGSCGLHGDHFALMQKLKDEHVVLRRLGDELATANTSYRTGDLFALQEIVDKLEALVQHYPKHIEAEDTLFYPAAMTYISENDQKTLLDEFRDFDSQMIHEKYWALAEDLWA